MIAFDSITHGSVELGTSFSYSHTCSGNDRVVFVCVSGEDVACTVTYDGVSMTKLVEDIAAAASRGAVFGLLNPPTGSKTIAVSFADSHYIDSHAISYSSALQSGLPDATNIVSSGASPLTGTITTVLDNCWSLIYAQAWGGGVISASTNVTRRDAGEAGSYRLVGDYGPKTPAGNLAQTVTYTGGGTSCRLLQVSFAPKPTVGGNFLLFL